MGDAVRVLSLWQPWASAIAFSLKQVETRGWRTAYRGPLAIHAAKRWTREEAEWWQRLRKNNPRWYNKPPLGVIVATCELVDCRPTETCDVSDEEAIWGNYAPDRFGWFLEHIKALPDPIPFRGQQGFFNVPDELLFGPTIEDLMQ